MYNKAGGEDEQAGQQTKRGNAGFYGHYAADIFILCGLV